MSAENPWKTLGTRLVYENPWIRVREDSVTRPDGKPGIYGVVESRVATGVLALEPDRTIHLVGQYRYPTEHYSWEIIEGGAEIGEDPIEAARRELREEGGLTAAEWRQLGDEVHLSNCFSAERAVLFVATGLSAGESQPDGTEVLQLRRLPFEEAVAMVDSGEIKDALSILGILRLERALRNGEIRFPS